MSIKEIKFAFVITPSREVPARFWTGMMVDSDEVAIWLMMSQLQDFLLRCQDGSLLKQLLFIRRDKRWSL